MVCVVILMVLIGCGIFYMLKQAKYGRFCCINPVSELTSLIKKIVIITATMLIFLIYSPLISANWVNLSRAPLIYISLHAMLLLFYVQNLSYRLQVDESLKYVRIMYVHIMCIETDTHNVMRSRTELSHVDGALKLCHLHLLCCCADIIIMKPVTLPLKESSSDHSNFYHSTSVFRVLKSLVQESSERYSFLEQLLYLATIATLQR